MAFGDEQIERLTGNLDAVLAKRISQIDEMLDDKINQVTKIVNGIEMTNTTRFNTPEVEKAKPV